MIVFRLRFLGFRLVRRAAADEMDDFQLVAVIKRDSRVAGLGHDLQVALYRYLAGVKADIAQQLLDRDGSVEMPLFAVYGQVHERFRLPCTFKCLVMS